MHVCLMAIREVFYRRKMLKSGNFDIDKMTGKEFEKFLLSFLQETDIKLKPQNLQETLGVDLDLINSQGKKIVVQAKRYKNNVGIKAVQEVASGKVHYQASEAWVITNSFFTKAAIELAKSNQVKLFNRDALIEWLFQNQSKSVS